MRFFAAVVLSVITSALASPATDSAKPATATLAVNGTAVSTATIAAKGEPSGRVGNHTLSPDATGTVYFCVDADYQGSCSYLYFTGGQCYSFYHTYWNDKVSSFQPSSGANCQLWTDSDCPGTPQKVIQYPGVSNFKDIGFNDKLSSYKCFVA